MIELFIGVGLGFCVGIWFSKMYLIKTDLAKAVSSKQGNNVNNDNEVRLIILAIEPDFN